MQVTQLNLFPIKSTQAYGVQQAFVQPQGLNFDREFMITEPDGKFITARKDKVLYQIATFPLSQGLLICFEKKHYLVRYSDFMIQQSCEVWGTHFPSWVAADSANQWLSSIFQRPVQLRWLGKESSRQVANFELNPMSFGDSNPILLCSEKSLEQVRQWSPVELEMGQFRANIVIDGEIAFEEEQWQQIQIGDVKFQFAQHCTRCMMITRNLHSFELDPESEPFRTLKKQHTNEQGKPIFGIHLVPLNSGMIRVGEKLDILK